MHPYIHCSFGCGGQEKEEAEAPLERWLDKEGVVHVPNEVPLSHGKDKNTAIC